MAEEKNIVVDLSVDPAPGQKLLEQLINESPKGLLVITYSKNVPDGVKVVFLTSEKQEDAEQAKKDWGGMPEEWTFLGLQDNSLAVHIHDTYAPELEIVGPRSPLPNKYGGFKGNSKHPKLGSGRLYPHGAVQPGAIFIHKETSVLVYRWTVDSNPANLGGAMGRPQWRPTMKVIASNLKRIEAGEEGVELLEGDCANAGSSLSDAWVAIKFVITFKWFSTYVLGK
ncbi:hypothetical protein TrVE_jg982 [Triparma verrucosa]|uniref:Uncharacterized protein n=1 Tax=Triparma verrucosa TaxID=1606542 RepID=A0A9W7KYG1_9STRA|nr:hypothetical protein TrVE_jg982 [Triparma verrucosa]